MFSKVAGLACTKNNTPQLMNLLKLTLLYACFPRFLNCTNGIKSCEASHTNLILMSQSTSEEYLGLTQTSLMALF